MSEISAVAGPDLESIDYIIEEYLLESEFAAACASPVEENETEDIHFSEETPQIREQLTGAQLQLIIDNETLVHGIIKKLSATDNRRPQADMESDGFLGLFDAVRKYDPSNEQGASFQTYAARRITGTIIDGTRSYFGRHGQKASVLTAQFDSLDAPVNTQGSRTYNELVSDQPTPEEAIERSEIVCWLQMAINQLPERGRQAVTMHYFEERTLLSIGQALGISESGASKLVTRSIASIRKRQDIPFS